MKIRIAILAVCASALALPHADAGGFKIGENENPRPTDRALLKKQKTDNTKNGIAVPTDSRDVTRNSMGGAGGKGSTVIRVDNEMMKNKK